MDRPARTTHTALLLGVLLAASLIGCGGSEPRPVSSVVLITVDTLRADVLGAYGGTAVAAPNIDRLAAEGLRFDDAVVPMPLTRPSHFSLFTGRYPREHGVVNNQLALPDDAVTLAETFRDAGFAPPGSPAWRCSAKLPAWRRGSRPSATPRSGTTPPRR